MSELNGDNHLEQALTDFHEAHETFKVFSAGGEDKSQIILQRQRAIELGINASVMLLEELYTMSHIDILDMQSASPPVNGTESHLSSGQAAIALGVTKPTIHRWTNSGQLESWRTTGGHRRIPISSIRKALQEGHIIPTEQH
jgi:excisionase family DNA binding protein